MAHAFRPGAEAVAVPVESGEVAGHVQPGLARLRALRLSTGRLRDRQVLGPDWVPTQVSRSRCRHPLQTLPRSDWQPNPVRDVADGAFAWLTPDTGAAT